MVWSFEGSLPPFIGGVLIGLASTLLLWLSGRISGISGIVGGIVRPARGDVAWRALFVVGLVAGALLYRLVNEQWQPPVPSASLGTLAAAGLLVGFGTRMAGGCTSGHGVCGLGRLSRRSFVAVLTFMLAAIVTVTIVRHA